MKNYFNKTKQFIISHRVLSVILLIVILLIGYYIYKKIASTTGETRYVTTKVEKDTIISSISGTGQVSASNQIDIKAKASGDILYIGVASGQKVNGGTLIAQLDTKDTQKTIRDAESSLESAKLSLEKLKVQNSNENMNADLLKAYDDGFNTVSNAFLDLPTVMTGLDDIFYKANLAIGGQLYIDWYEGQTGPLDRDKAKVYKEDVNNSYNVARKAYEKNFEDYKKVSRNSDNITIENIILETYSTTKIIADAIKTANNYIDFVKDSMGKNNFDIPPIIASHQSSLSSYTSKTNSHLINLSSTKTSIKNNKDAFLNTDLDIRSSELSIKQKENALQDAKDKLSDYSIRAPFAGTISNINIKKTDSVSSGAIIGTLITEKQIAEILLNEVDVAKVQIGQKATLTFDAVLDLTISGKVVEIDSIGTVSQGVVSYEVKINFDTDDSRIKPGMSVGATIITDIKQDVLVVPNSAVKSQNGTNYVEIFSTPLSSPIVGVQGSLSLVSPDKNNVEIGISNDTMTEIISGIKEGDVIVTKTITATTSATSTPSILNAVGGNKTGAGNATRALGR